MKLLIFLFLAISSAAGYHILCIQMLPSKSHYVVMYGIIKPLLKAGHQVTFMTTYPNEEKVRNLTTIDISHLLEFLKVEKYLGSEEADTHMLRFAKNISTETIVHPEVQRAIVKNNYDAVLTEWFFSEVESGYAAIQQVPWIMLCGTLLPTHMEYLVDTTRSISTLPEHLNFFPIPLNFWQRLMNTYKYIKIRLDFWTRYPSMKSNYESFFGPLAKARGVPLPPFEDAHRNVSIMLVNSDPSFDPVRVLPPNVIHIGGCHIEDNTPRLPQDIQDIMDASPQGVIYFSLGSIAKSSMMKATTVQEFLQMFAELPYTVLWKFENELEDLPKNVHIRSWLPQTSILAHPNIKIFMTHGGLLSVIESHKYGVPLLNMPVFGDHPDNAHKNVMSGAGLRVDFSENMIPDLRIALNEMLSNDSYYQKAKSLSAIFNKRAVSTSTLIVHYIELAIETGGAYHLRSKTNLYAWYEHMMLDQLLLILVVIYLLKFAAQKNFSLLSKDNRIKKNQ